MNFQQILTAICYSGFLAMSMSIIIPYLAFANPTQLKETTQTTIINLSIDEFKEKYLLKIRGSRHTDLLTGNIKLNGIIIAKFTNNSTQINLSPVLKKGKNTIDIMGSYTPITSAFKLELIGINTRVTQENTGNGNIANTLIIYVD